MKNKNEKCVKKIRKAVNQDTRLADEEKERHNQ